ncbi:MAG TPA: hypothetical protein VFX33_13995 [Actinomycetales bacterium]|nr:hypothetical protein [Actinomycetales bacterium]
MSSLVRMTRLFIWALPAWATLLLLATLTHQPPYQTRFEAWSRYVTTPEFLVSHLVGSILGGALGILGFVGLGLFLVGQEDRRTSRLAVPGVVCSVIGNVFVIAVFGIAAFAQPAIGRSYLAGHADVRPLYDDVNGVPLLVTALCGVLLLSLGVALLGLGIVRSGMVPSLAGWSLVVGAPVFAILGVVLADAVQTVGAALLLAGSLGTAYVLGRGDLAVTQGTSSEAAA